MKLYDALNCCEQRLAEAHRELPRLLAELLLADLLKCPRLELLLRRNDELQPDLFEPQLERLCQFEPLQYVIGSADFMGLHLKCDKRALIPRPETEQLVLRFLEHVSSPDIYLKLADVGTGTGCIALGLADALPHADILAVDAQEAALSLAHENVIDHAMQGRVTLRLNHLLAGFPAGSLDALLSNLPYIPTDVCEALPQDVRTFEPRSALDGGPDGLDLVRELTVQAATCLKPGGWMLLEIGEEQGDAVKTMMEDCGFVSCSIVRDLADRVRMVEGRRPF